MQKGKYEVKLVAALLFITALFISVPVEAADIDPWAEPLEKIYWGDLHVHTAYSLDAFLLGMAPGRYVDEAGLYALYCSRLDFYSVTDHANIITDTNYWEKTIRSSQHFNQIGKENPDENGDPSIVVFPGWEWTLGYAYGHKNVIFKYDDPEKLPPSPIRCRPGVQGLPGFTRNINLDFDTGELYENLSFFKKFLIVFGLIYGYMQGDNDTTFIAETSGELFEQLRMYSPETVKNREVIVIPHGNAWAVIPARHTDWDLQLNPKDHDPEMQRLIEVYSKHGNSEEYSYFPPIWRYFKDGREVPEKECFVEVEPDFANKMTQRIGGGPPKMEMLPECTRKCPEPTESYIPCCWRAGEIVAKRCLDPESDFCREQIELARAEVQPFPLPLSEEELNQIKPEYQANPGEASAADWGACGQCLDCWQPAWNYRNNSSVQKALASAYFDEKGDPLHYRFGFISSTDTHTAWGGSVKETKGMTEGNMNPVQEKRPALEYPAPERADNFLNPGGLAAILAGHRTKDDLWDSLLEKNVYSTSGARIDVWARAVVGSKVVKMGAESNSTENPTFYIKANGAFIEEDTCPYDDEPLIQNHFSRDEFEHICRCQCYRITEQRVPIARIEVVKVLQPMNPEEANMSNLERSPENPKGLIMDPYFVAEFDNEQIEWTWTDSEFENEPPGRSVAYYFRIIQTPTPGYNCRPIALLESGRNCNLKDNPKPSDVESLINPQDGSEPTSLLDIEDPCYSNSFEPESYCQERAWTSPFYIIKQ